MAKRINKDSPFSEKAEEFKPINDCNAVINQTVRIAIKPVLENQEKMSAQMAEFTELVRKEYARNYTNIIILYIITLINTSSLVLLAIKTYKHIINHF